MAKNFTDFQEITGTYTPPTVVDGINQGTKQTDATKEMYLVGYDVDEPGGERRYTVDSVLLAASAHHVGLENVENKSLGQILDNTTLTGVTTADNVKIIGDLIVEGAQTTMNTTIASTSAFGIICTSPLADVIGIEVQQFGPGAIARFLDGEDLALDVGSNGNVGVGIEASDDTSFTVLGDISANGDVHITGAFNGRYVQQDGAKLDNIQPHADVTGLNLANVEQRLQELALTDEHSGVVVGKGFDLLEDGEAFHKTPALSSVAAPGVGDYSTEKLASVEYESDKTADHSHDITFNLIPDGPFTGDVDTTFVKMTSAEHDRVNSVRGVADPLYASDDGEDITATHIAAAYHDAYPDFWSTGDEVEYRDVIIPKVTESYNTVTANSAWWHSTYMTTKNTSGDWSSAYSTVYELSGDWESTHTSVLETSANWDSTHMSVLATSSKWDSTSSSVLATSSKWDSTHASVLATSGDWNSTYNTTQSNSAEWSASINNTLDDSGNHVSLPAGEANLTKVNITESLTAQSDTRLGGEVYVLSAGEWKQGITADIPLGDDMLHFVDGILIHWDRGGV